MIRRLGLATKKPDSLREPGFENRFEADVEVSAVEPTA